MGVMRVLPRWFLPKGREQTDCAQRDFQPSALPINLWCLPGTPVILCDIKHTQSLLVVVFVCFLKSLKVP